MGGRAAAAHPPDTGHSRWGPPNSRWWRCRLANSAPPASLQGPAQEQALAALSTTCLPLCLPAGGGDGTDLEIQPLRVAVSREAWEGLPGSYNPSSQSDGEAEQQEASRR